MATVAGLTPQAKNIPAGTWQLGPDALSRFQVIAFPWRKDAVPLNDVLISLSWSEAADKAAVEATIVVDNHSGFAKDVLAPGGWIEVMMIHPVTKKWVYVTPRLRIFSRGATDSLGSTATIVAHDIVTFLMANGEQTYFFRKTARHPKGWTAAQIAKEILFDLEVPARVIDTAYRIPYLLLKDVTPYDAIVTAFTEDYKHTKAMYRVRAGRYDPKVGGMVDRARLIIEPVLYQEHTWDLDEKDNLFTANWEESMEGVKTEFIGVSVDEKTGREIRRVRALSKETPRYGRMRLIELMPKKTASQMNKIANARLTAASKLKRTASVTAQGVPMLRASDAMTIVEHSTGLIGKFYSSSVSHTVDSSGHNVAVDVSWVAIFPQIFATPEQLIPAKAAAGVSGVGAAGGRAGEGAVRFCLAQRGEPYVWGATGPDSWDCSGLTQAGWKSVGVSIPRVTQDQIKCGTEVSSLADAAAGDLLFPHIGHVLMYMGDGTNAVQAPHTGDVVKVTSVRGQSFIAIRRPVPLEEQGAGSGTFNVDPYAMVAAGETTIYAPGQLQPTGNTIGGPVISGSEMASKINVYLRAQSSPLAGLGDAFVSAGNGSNVDPRFLCAITGAETSFGKYPPCQRIHNPFGLGPGLVFPTWEDAINKAASTLGGPIYKGLHTIQQIQQKWAPAGAQNDPGGLNNNWTKNVSNFYRALGGNPAQPVK